MRDGYQLKLVSEHTWADCPRLGEASFSPDSSLLYLLKMPDELNLGAAAVWFWPEALSLVALVLIWKAIRRAAAAMRHRQERTKMYCRGCGYDLSATAEGVVCPECGKKRRARGRGLARRAMPLGCAAVVLACLSACVYVLHWREHAPRWLEPGGPCSRTACTWAERIAPAWAHRLSMPAGEIVRIDAATGASDREPITRLSRCVGEMRVSRDGQLAMVGGFRRDAAVVRVVDLAGGVVTAERALAGQPQHGGFMLGFDTQDRLLLVENDREHSRAFLGAWDPRTGATTRIGEEPTGAMGVGDTELFLPPNYAVSGDGGTIATVSSSLDHKPVEVAVWNTQTNTRTTVEGDWRRVIVSQGAFTLNSDGSLLYLPVSGSPACWRMPGGERATPERPQFKYINDPCASAQDAGLIATVSAVDSSLTVLRWGGAEQVAELSLPRKTVVMNVAFSGDGRHIAVVGFDYTANRPKDAPYVHRAYLYELSGGDGKAR